MDIKQSISYKYDRNKLTNNIGNNKYNYSKNGLLNKCIPKILFKGNSLLVTFLQLIDVKCVMLFKYIDTLKNFKNITSYY